jgi:hypothetical protein
MGSPDLASARLVPGPARVTPPPTNPGEMPFQMLPPGRQAKTGTGRLRGRVVAADTGAALRRAQVRISGPDIGTKTALTDLQGRYEFKDLPAGRFTIGASKSGFVPVQYGQTRPFERGRPIDLADAQTMEKVDIAMPRGSAVSGRIVDELGEPVADVSVSAMRMQYSGGRRRLAPAGRMSTTNDLGQFRVFGLPPGEYYISATLRTFDSMMMDMFGGGGPGGPSGSNNSSGYAATYYPGTPNPGEAQRISLAVGQEMTSAEIQLQPVRLARITGSAVGSDGKAMSGAMVMLMPTMREAIMVMPGVSQTDKDGNFTLSGVPPGEYSLQVQSLAAIMSAATQAMKMMGGADTEAAPAPQPMEREFATASLSVAGEDITGLVITGTRGATATGRIVFDDGAKPEKITALRVSAAPTDPDIVPAVASVFGMTSVKETGAFEVDGLVGGRVFRCDPPKGWFLKRVTHEGRDITDTGYEFKPGEEVDGFEIVLTTRSQMVTGSVTNDKGEPVKEYTVVVFADDPQKWTGAGNRWRASARPDQQGQFKIADLPPGRYLAIAVEYVAEGEWADPEWLARAANNDNVTKFTLDEGGAKRLDLKRAGS